MFEDFKPFILILILTIILLILYLFSDKFRKWIKKIFVNDTDSPDKSKSKQKIKEKLFDGYLKPFKDDYKEHKLSLYYSQMFDLTEFDNTNYRRKTERAKDIFEKLSLDMNDLKPFEQILNDELKNIKKDCNIKDYGEAITFLYDWYENKAEIEALESIKNDIKEKDKKFYKKKIKEVKDYKESLLNRL